MHRRQQSRVLVSLTVLAAGFFGTALAPAAAQTPTPTTSSSVLAFAGAPALGGPTGPDAGSVVALAATPSGQGYWVTRADGAVFSFGNAAFAGGMSGQALRQPVVTMAASRTGQGYWLAASDGGIFAFGDAVFAGSTGAIRLNQPVVGMARTPSGGGYWLVARDGGIFAFGDAVFYGSTGAIRLNRPIVGMAPTPSGAGYWLVAADGGVFAFGDAVYHGGTASLALARPIVGMAASSSGGGYWMAGADSGIFAFGDAAFGGDGRSALAAGSQVVAIAAAPGTAGYWLASANRPVGSGAVGPGIEGIQRRLSELGFWGPVDGTFGALTTQQVYAFQKANNLPRDGVLSPEEVEFLGRADRPRPRSTSGYVAEVDKTRQLLIIGRDGYAEHVFNVSTGNGARYAPGAVAITPEGRFRIQRQINGLRISSLGALFRPKYFTGGYAVHGSPSIPPFPASHGCVRVSNGAIDFIWANRLLEVGMDTWVYS